MSVAPEIPALLTMDHVRRHFIPLDPRTLRRWISAGRFPQADMRIGGKVRMWKRETVERWIEEQSAAA
jgi:predicted DNA-binding transcriptional regulator AlpA